MHSYFRFSFRHVQTYSSIIQEYIHAYLELSVSLVYSKPWYISIAKHILALRYIHNAILNIFPKAQSRTFDANRNASLFYRCHLTSRATLHIFNVIFQNSSGLIQPYLVLLRHAKSPGIFGTFSFSHTEAYSTRCTQYLGTFGHIY